MGELAPNKTMNCATNLPESASSFSFQIPIFNEMVSATGGDPMKLSETRPYLEQAESCALKAEVTPFPVCKKHWEDMAGEWSAMANSMVEKDVYGKAIP